MNKELRQQAIDWILECPWEDDLEDLEDELHSLTDAELIKSIDKYYSGGWEQFVLA